MSDIEQFFLDAILILLPTIVAIFLSLWVFYGDDNHE